MTIYYTSVAYSDLASFSLKQVLLLVTVVAWQRQGPMITEI